MELSSLFLNAYQITHPELLTWHVNTYRVTPEDGSPNDEERGDNKSVIWDIKKRFSSNCKGYGFVVDFSDSLVAVPFSWDLPSGVSSQGRTVTKEGSRTVQCGVCSDWPIVSGILREAVKRHFKNELSTELGCLWQDYNAFCQAPCFGSNGRVVFCRRFQVVPEVLRNSRPVLQMIVTTTGIDTSSLADYYNSKRLAELAEMIKAKRGERLTRRNEQTAVRVLRKINAGRNYEVLDLVDADSVIQHASLPDGQLARRNDITLRCAQFGKPPRTVLAQELRLILGTQNTGEEHSETLLTPSERAEYMSKLRAFVQGMDVFGCPLHLSDTLATPCGDSTTLVAPPSVRVKGEKNGIAEIAVPSTSPESIQSRYRERASHIRKHGFLETAPMRPALAFPKCLSKQAGERMKRDLNYLVRETQPPVVFDLVTYTDVPDLQKQTFDHEYDALLVVLPEKSCVALGSNSTHDRLKRTLDVPSQCITFDHTLPQKWVNEPIGVLKKVEPRLLRRVQDRYRLCIDNLLVKAGWLPFLPSQRFHYNVHIGIDVGGQHNNEPMLCLGHGFGYLDDPQSSLAVLPRRLPISCVKVEPLPTNALCDGLLSALDDLRSKLNEMALSF